jgi:hypothetical protein
MKSILVLFKNLKLHLDETEDFRRDINIKTNNAYDLLYNHKPDGSVIYRYPKVQFRSYKGYAALFGLGEGQELIWQLLGSGELGQPYSSNYEIVQNIEEPVQVVTELSSYSIRNILPFNTESFKEYKKLDSLPERAAFLEIKLANHLITFCKEMEVPFTKGDIVVKLKDFTVQPHAHIKKEEMERFDAIIQTNLSLPDFLGLGRSKALGFGVMKKI